MNKYWIPGPITNYSTTETGFRGEVRVVLAADYNAIVADYETLKRAVNEATDECGPDCGNWGHDAKCPACDPARWLTDQQKEIESLRERLADKEVAWQAEREINCKGQASLVSLTEENRVRRERAEAAEKETKHVKRRVQAGVCICCNRTFQNLARHMATKHGANA